MKRNMKRAMERMKIDSEIQNIIGKMWKHGYKTLHSCEGHEPSKEEPQGTFKYVSYKSGTGDGWFEQNSYDLGFIGYMKSKLEDPITKKLVPAVAYYSRD
jgi:hypothetical protein